MATLGPSSPRLPSPPPPAEIQLGPPSPSGGVAETLTMNRMDQDTLNANSQRRIHPGTKAADMAAGPPLVPLNELDSAFQLQEHLAALHYHYSNDNGTQPITREIAYQLAQPPPGIDRTLWLYELCRFLISQCNTLIVGFLFDAPPCSATTCPEMRASEWQFLCAVHEQPKSCCAIDYCCHTLDWAANIVTDQKLFPSRFVAIGDSHGSAGAGGKNIGVKSLVHVFRRLHRIFAHAWFQHRSVFWEVEGQTGLYVFFKTVCDLYDLLPSENYKLPPEAEGLEAVSVESEPEKPIPQILKPRSQQQQQRGSDENDYLPVNRSNTRRHIRSSPSTGSSVTTVMEADEEEAGALARKVRDMHLHAPETVSEEPESTNVPVTVEHDKFPVAPEGADEEKTTSGADAPEPQPVETGTDASTDPTSSDTALSDSDTDGHGKRPTSSAEESTREDNAEDSHETKAAEDTSSKDVGKKKGEQASTTEAEQQKQNHE